MVSTRSLLYSVAAVLLAGVASSASAAQLSLDAKAAIPRDVQQIIVVDYRAMQNSPAAMSLKDRVLPPELKRLETALTNSGLKVDSGCRSPRLRLLPRPRSRANEPDQNLIVGIAQGQFHTRDILANFAKNKVKPQMLRNNSIYPMGSTGMSVVFLNQTTMVFGDKDAINAALDARDGMRANFLPTPTSSTR